jgi:hypothetical protein
LTAQSSDTCSVCANGKWSVAGLGTADGSAYVAGTTDTVFLALQGTGDLTVKIKKLND